MTAKKQIYTFGNTTVRNTTRFPEGLRVLENSKFNGDINTKEAELGFARALDNANVTEMTKGNDDSSGRKWRSALDKTGFITISSIRRNKLLTQLDPLIMKVKSKYPNLPLSGKASEITPQGHRLALANNIYEMQDSVLRALLAIQIDSFDVDGQLFKPFVFTLQVLDELRKMKEKKGLNRNELLIVFSVSDHSKAYYIAKQIIEYRKERSNCEGKRSKSKFDRQFLSKFAKMVGVKYETAITYSDPNFNYMMGTGLFSRQGSRMIFNQEKLAIIKDILDTEPKFINNQIDYYYNLWNGYPLPTDNQDVLIDEVKRLAKLTNTKLSNKELSYTVPDLKQLMIRLEEKQSSFKEGIFAKEQRSDDNITNIISYLKVINGEIKSGDEYENAQDDMPTFFEWTTWRAFLAIDGLKNQPEKSRGFQVDQDFFPIGHAPGGRPDIILEFEDYVLIVEVTLTSSSRQEAAEAEPVRRHIALIQEQYPNKSVYGLFLAPTIDNNTAEMFRTGIWYHGTEPTFVNIVPMTITQFIYIMSEFRENHFNNAKFERLIEKCLIPRNATVPLWKNGIESVVKNFKLF